MLLAGVVFGRITMRRRGSGRRIADPNPAGSKARETPSVGIQSRSCRRRSFRSWWLEQPKGGETPFEEEENGDEPLERMALE